MRRFFYSATAMVVIGLLTGNSIWASEPLKLSITGNMQEWFGVVKKQKKDTGSVKSSVNTFGINTDNEINFKALSRLDNGIEVEALIRLSVYDNNMGPNNNNGSPGLDEQWVAVGSTLGKVYAGAKDSINTLLHNQAIDYGIGYGDVNIWTKGPATALGSNLPVAGAGPRNRTSFQPMASHVPMVGYISPKIGGLQLGLSYSPNPGILGTNDATKFTATDHWDATLGYTGEFSGMTLGLDGGFAHQDGVDTTVRGDIEAWNMGLKVGFAGLTLGTSYLDRQHPGTQTNDGNAWNAGVAYANGPWGVSYTYFQEMRRGAAVATDSKSKRNEQFQTHLVSSKYNIGPGVDLKASVFHGKFKGRDRDADDQNTYSYGLVSGVDLTF